jgi:hypothetical protein
MTEQLTVSSVCTLFAADAYAVETVRKRLQKFCPTNISFPVSFSFKFGCLNIIHSV